MVPHKTAQGYQISLNSVSLALSAPCGPNSYPISSPVSLVFSFSLISRGGYPASLLVCLGFGKSSGFFVGLLKAADTPIQLREVLSFDPNLRKRPATTPKSAVLLETSHFYSYIIHGQTVRRSDCVCFVLGVAFLLLRLSLLQAIAGHRSYIRTSQIDRRCLPS